MRTMTFTFDSNNGPMVVLTATESNGSIGFSLSQTGPVIGDLRGLFLQLSNESLLPGLRAQGLHVTDQQFKANSVKDLGDGANVNGVKTGPFDLGIEFGTAGMAKDDIRETAFVLSHSSKALTLDDIALQNFAVRLTSVGVDGGARNDSLKLVGTAIDPVDARDDTVAVGEDEVFTGTVLGNDLPSGSTPPTVVEVDGDVLNGESVTIPFGLGGLVTVNADGTFTVDAEHLDYLAQGEELTTSFTYRIADYAPGGITGSSDTATVVLTVTGVNDAPVAAAQFNQVTEDSNVPATGSLLVGATDVDNNAQVSLKAGLAGQYDLDYGTLTVDSTGAYSYALDNADPLVQALSDGQTLTDTFAFKVQDEFGAVSDEKTLTITIKGVTDPSLGPPIVNEGNGTNNGGGETGSGVDLSPASHFPVIINDGGQSAAISNLTLYLDSGAGGNLKVKIDNFSDATESGLTPDVYDADSLDLAAFVQLKHPGSILVAVAIKAGSNAGGGAGGEGQIFLLDGNPNDSDYADALALFGQTLLSAPATTTYEYANVYSIL